MLSTAAQVDTYTLTYFECNESRGRWWLYAEPTFKSQRSCCSVVIKKSYD
jgi:hypothetical protein